MWIRVAMDKNDVHYASSPEYPERQIMHAIIEGRGENGITQKQLADITGITQADISRLENGTANPSLKTLKRLAAGMGMALKLEFVPTNTQI